MKIHISNLYNFNRNDLIVKKHHQFAEAGRSLGFLEMGIFDYPVETDSVSELSKRLDGMIASLESEDVVFLQLPTKNGIDFEKKLAGKIKAYRNTKLIMILHNSFMENVVSCEYIELYKMADGLVVFSKNEMMMLQNLGILQIVCAEDVLYTENIEKNVELLNCVGNGYLSLCKNDFQIKRLFMNALDSIYSLEKTLVKNAVKHENEIQIGFGLHDKTGNYSVWVGTVMQSIIEHTNSKICFHILHDDTLNRENKMKLAYVAETAGDRIEFHLIDASEFEQNSGKLGRFTVGTMFRLLLPDILKDISKIIYLDADLFVNRDIRELWDTNIDDYAMAAVPDMGVVFCGAQVLPVLRGKVARNRYFNAGVLYLNLDKIRKKGHMKTQIMSYLDTETEWHLPDQDALNVIYNKETLLLDSSWNCFVLVARDTEKNKLDKKIYHYAATCCYLDAENLIDFAFWQTIGRTPWQNTEYTKILKHSLGRSKERLEQLERIMPLVIEKNIKRIFYGNETFAMKNIYKLVSVRENDYRILIKPDQEDGEILPCKDFSCLERENEKFVVFVLPEADNWTAINRLEKLGLKRGEEYFVIPVVLSAKDGGFV